MARNQISVIREMATVRSAPIAQDLRDRLLVQLEDELRLMMSQAVLPLQAAAAPPSAAPQGGAKAR